MNSLNEEGVIADYLANLSTYEIATKYNTYPNKVLRILRKHGIKIRSFSDSAKLSIEKGTHPMAGRTLTEEEKLNLSEKNLERWSKLSDEEKKQISEIAKKNWKKIPRVKKETMSEEGQRKCREVIDRGSRLERYVANHLVDNGVDIQFHKNMLTNGRLEVDIYVPSYKTIIEVNGPSHFLPIWGQKNLEKQQESDEEKFGLILRSGFNLIKINMRKYTRSIALYNRAAQKALELLGNFEKLAEIEV